MCSSIVKELMGSSRCTWGPSYWCSSHETAVECNVSIYIVNANYDFVLFVG